MKKHFFTFSLLLLPSLLAAQEQELVVIQTGAENEARLIQENSFGMEGYGSFLSLEQHGDRNNSHVEQRGGNNYTALLQQGNHNGITFYGMDDNSEAVISQVGKENRLFVQTSTSCSTIWLRQGQSMAGPGVRNEGIVQAGGSNNYVLLEQLGESNFASIAQGIMVNAAVIQQAGLSNFAVITQPHLYSGAGIEQVGNNHSAIVNQEGEGAIMDLLQMGEGNWLSLEQSGTLTEANLLQEGSFNRMDIVQNSSWRVLISATQRGEGNRMELRQVEDMYHEIQVEQDGNFNFLTVVQAGTEHTFRGKQLGNENSLVVVQEGTLQHATIHQVGNGLSATIMQQ